ncbi:uncharacterized protein BDR25DRAFT_387430 [Lindgomyces ingoldianus]|uniref:Uncharacterized protein n=1 Tax=Lindgomyces ingoldianus TaxID=673940 RepID=A0ACB6R2A2_9PLEO|nr:uncharacterized protein BDR25DRAFT_387430 [Lindgomyces ingoldianus]KAF2473276.1 hypothetical protein BDR25DRAFT_387430 [Lindgomyces ingoldianus]
MKPSPPHSNHLTRDKRLQVQALRLANNSHKYIASFLNYIERQVQYTAARERITPKKLPDRPSIFTDAQINQIEVFICSARTGRLLSYTQLANKPFSDAVCQRGHPRCVGLARPPLSPSSRRKRLKWTLPPSSADLNPIVIIWNLMKDCIHKHYRDVQLSYDHLQVAVRVAWDSITEAQLQELFESMRDRCAAGTCYAGSVRKIPSIVCN